jgi:hypothetical protein
VVAQPEGADDHERYRVDQNLRQGLAQEAAHPLRGKVRGQIDGQYEQRYGDGEDPVRKSDDPVVDVPPNPTRGMWCDVWGRSSLMGLRILAAYRRVYLPKALQGASRLGLDGTLPSSRPSEGSPSRKPVGYSTCLSLLTPEARCQSLSETGAVLAIYAPAQMPDW